jgi:hypothetical protein
MACAFAHIGVEPFMEKFSLELGESNRVTLDKGPTSRVQWNRAFLLVKSFKLFSRPLDEGPRPRQIKLWFCLHGIILKGKPIGLDQSKSLEGELMGKLVSKVVHCFCFFSLFHYFLLSCCSNSMRMEDMLWIEDINESTSILPFWPILKLTWLVLCILTRWLM